MSKSDDEKGALQGPNLPPPKTGDKPRTRSENLEDALRKRLNKTNK